MTNEELQAITERAEAATPGPWEVYSDSRDGVRGRSGPVCEIVTGDLFQLALDIDFIARARADIPALLAEITDLRARLARRASECYYCGEVMPADDTQAQADHWRTCPSHPARASLAEVWELNQHLESELARLRNENSMLQVAVDHWAGQADYWSGQARIYHDAILEHLEP